MVAGKSLEELGASLVQSFHEISFASKCKAKNKEQGSGYEEVCNPKEDTQMSGNDTLLAVFEINGLYF